MVQSDWRRAGDQIKRMVEDAVESGDFSQLGDTISDVVNDTMDGIESVLKDIPENFQNRQEDPSADWRSGPGGRGYARTNREAAERIRKNVERKMRTREAAQTRQQPVRIDPHVPGEIGGRVMKYLGYVTGGFLGVICLAAGTAGVFLNMAAGFGTALIFGVLAGAGFALGHRGSERLKLGQRFRRYLDVIGDRTYCLVRDLAAAVGKSENFVRKDLRRLIGQGYFREGYLDQKGTLLITDNETWQQYQTTQAEYEKRQAEEQRQAKEQRQAGKDGNSAEYGRMAGAAKYGDAGGAAQAQGAKYGETADAGLEAAKSKLSPEYRELISEGESYIRYIHECNDRIPGEEISAKLDRLELVVTRIFWEAARNPEAIPDLKKMMSYYLPTTHKLLDAYCEMDAQPIQGQNIENTKAEIERALDTLNQAFENLLDSLFEEKAWDISSDISVLNTMLAQEGLTGSDFEKRK